ncbi:hypothetical protein [Ralstonia solanacearum]|uniref:hypothetical protein n=1 Tax=Ralstonia solanacearum TaxID=305 RepID=UPI0012DA6427|nr:hypothetical protein [Ralstonia solanacearum]
METSEYELNNSDYVQARKRGNSVSRGMVIATAIVVIVAGALFFGNFEKSISDDFAAASVLIAKMEDSNELLSGCEFDSNGEFYKCDGLSKKLAQIKGEGEEIIITGTGELVGVNFPRRVVVVLKPRRGPDGRIDFSCSVWPKNAAPRGCRYMQRSK